MSDYTPHRVPRTEVPIGESEPLTSYIIYAPGADKFYAPTRVQAERIADEFNRLLRENELLTRTLDEINEDIVKQITKRPRLQFPQD